MRPTIRQLEYVVAVAEEAHFGRAAARCFVSQPALSNQIRQVELQLGVELFERTSRGVLVTAAGERVATLARQLLEKSDEIVDQAKATTGPLSGVVRMGSVSTVTPYLLPAAMSDIAEAFPELELRVTDDTAERLKAALASGNIDVLLVPTPTGSAQFEEIVLAHDPFLLATYSGSRIDALPEPVRIEDLAGHELMLLDEVHCLRGQVLELCHQANASSHPGFQGTSLSAIVQMVRRRFGSTILPAITRDVELTGLSEIKLKRFASPSPGRNIGLAWRKGAPDAQSYRALGSILMRHAMAEAAWDEGLS